MVGLLAKQLFPEIKSARNERLSVGLPLQASEQQQEAGSKTESWAGSFGGDFVTAKCDIKCLQPSWIREMLLLTCADPGEAIKISRQPPLVLGEQLLHEIAGIARIGPDQFSP